MYARKILFTFGLLWLVANLGWIISSYYYMSNSSAQAGVFAVHGIIVIHSLLLAGLAILAWWISPINQCINLLQDKQKISDDLLLTAAKKNNGLPMFGMILYDIMLIIFGMLSFIDYRSNHIGMVGSTGIWMAILAAIFAVALIVYGFFNLLTRGEFALFIEETEKRNIAFTPKGMRMQTELLALVIMVLLANIAFNTSLGFYDGYNQIKIEVKESLKSFQQYIIQDISKSGRDITADSLKPVIDRITTSGIGESFLMSRSGQMIYNPGQIDIQVQRWEDINAEIEDAVKNGDVLCIYENIHERVICITPVNSEFSIGTVSGLNNRLSRFNTYWLWMLVFIGAAMFAGISCGYSTISSISETIVMAVNRLKTISKGEWDLTARLHIRNSNEVGDLIRWFNTFIATLQRIINDIAADAGILNTSAADLSKLSGNMSRGADQTSEKSDEVAAAVKEMNTSMVSMAAITKQSSSNFNNIVVSVESITSAISDITQSTNNLLSITEDAVSITANAMEKVDKLGGAAQAIGKITDVITDISDQTGLLALNASIEAARAAEAGKGFSVVAGEIKELSRQTDESILQIRSRIEHIQGETTETSAEIKKITDIIYTVNDSVSAIADTVDRVFGASKEISTSVSESSRGMAEVNQDVERNSSVAKTIEDNISEVNKNAGEMSDSSAHVDRTVTELARLANHMNELVKKFKIN